MMFERNKANMVKFDTIKEGELFKYGNDVLMKIESVTGSLTCDDEYDEWEFNAVNIVNGEVHCVYDFEEVKKVEYKLEIDD